MTGSWALREGALSALIRDRKIRVGDRSPLRRLPDPAQLEPASSPEEALVAALEQVAWPRLELGLLLSPPHGLDVLWFYLGESAPEGQLVGHLRDSSGQHCLAWTSEQRLLEQWADCLDLHSPVATPGQSLRLSRSGFQALLALIDANREWTLQSLLDRLPQPERTFSVERLVSVFQATLRSSDPRWLGMVAQLVTPFDFHLTTETCRSGIEEIARNGLVEPSTEGWILTPRMQQLATVMASPLAYASWRGHFPDRSGQWQRRHMAALRGLGALWSLEYPSEDEVHLSEPEPAELAQRAAQVLREWREGSRSSPETGTDDSIGCPECAFRLPPGSIFCSQCGVRIEVLPPAPGPRFCVACGTPRRDENRFCTGCGRSF